MNYYQILGIEINATQAQIKKAYRKLSKKLHPDVNQGDVFFEKMFIQVQEAYEVLYNTEKRSVYDAQLLSKKEPIHKRATPQSATPTIHFFYSDAPYFANGQKITFFWSCTHVDRIVLKPFGELEHHSGQIAFQINNYNKRILVVELIAENRKLNQRITKQLYLENKIFYEAKQKKGRPEVDYAFPHQVPLNGMAKSPYSRYWLPIGRINELTFIKRVGELTLFFGLLYLIIYWVEIIREWKVLALIGYVFTVLIQSMKRQHDMNQDGKLSVLLFIPYGNLIFLLYLAFKKGTRGANRFGYDPNEKN